MLEASMGIVAQLPDEDPIFITSWKGFRAFTDAIRQLGNERFPVILEQLPDGDEGITTPENAVLMLKELLLFSDLQAHIRQAVLVDSERGTDISMGSNVLAGALTTDRLTGYDLGFNEGGFFVRDRWELNRLLFQAMRVEQVLLHPESHQVRYIDLDQPERSFQCSTPFGKPMTGADGLPRMMLWRFHVEIRTATPDRFLYITAPLQRVLERSIELQQPIHWG
jgi:hypothetical protein